MIEVCTIATYKRTELLWLCLEAIRKQEPDMTIVVRSDRDAWDQDLEEAIKYFHALLDVAPRHKSYGNSLNVVEVLRLGLACNPQILHSIEDDTIVHPGYFAWARNELRKPNLSCAIGRVSGDPSGTWYTSPCVSWKAEMLRTCVQAIPNGYLAAETREEMQKILDACPTFAKSKYRYGSAEQDGFFLRCIEQFGWKTCFPPKSLASHIGWWSDNYNRQGHEGPKADTFAERVLLCRAALQDKKFRTAMFGQRITDEEMSGLEGI